MPELTSTEKIQPCLLDRLVDDEPKSLQESRTNRVVSLQRYREAVLRDLRWLFNASSHLAHEGFNDFPEVARSVINFGTRDLCGLMGSSLNLPDLERHITEAIENFEPRIIKRSLTVTVALDTQRANPSLLSFELRGELWARPIPDQFYIKTELDLETGQCALQPSAYGPQIT